MDEPQTVPDIFSGPETQIEIEFHLRSALLSARESEYSMLAYFIRLALEQMKKDRLDREGHADGIG